MKSEIKYLLETLYPICRSLTGKGNRLTFDILKKFQDFDVHEVPSGTKVFDWVVPEEWSINDAWIKDSNGKKIINFTNSNLHVINYSTSVDMDLPFDQLATHLHYLEDMPEAIPYRSSYYKKNWGFCLSYNQFKKLDKDAVYHVYIDANHDSTGSLTYGQKVHNGQSSKEILLSTYCCHPSLVNDNLSGLISTILLFNYISSKETYYSYRMVIAPETIGAITFLHENKNLLDNIIGGAVLTTMGGPGAFGMKESYLGDSIFDQAAQYALDKTGVDWLKYEFVPDGSDERQYCSPGIRIPTVTITKDKYYEYPEYHTSADDLSFVTPEQISKTIDVYIDWFDFLEKNRTYERVNPSCEFQLGKRGLYPQIGGARNQKVLKEVNEVSYQEEIKAMNWLMFACDGETDMISISKRSKLSLDALHFVAQKFAKEGLLSTVK